MIGLMGIRVINVLAIAMNLALVYSGTNSSWHALLAVALAFLWGGCEGVSL